MGYTEIELYILLYKWFIIENSPRYNLALNVHLQPSFVVDGVSRCAHLLMLDSIYIIPAGCRIRQPNNQLTPIYFGPRPKQERRGIYLVNESYKTIKNWYNKDNKTKQGKNRCTFHESYYKHHFLPFFQGQIKNTIASRLWPLWGEFTGDRWIPCTKGRWCGKLVHSMTSSWYHQRVFRIVRAMLYILNGLSTTGFIHIIWCCSGTGTRLHQYQWCNP